MLLAIYSIAIPHLLHPWWQSAAMIKAKNIMVWFCQFPWSQVTADQLDGHLLGNLRVIFHFQKKKKVMSRRKSPSFLAYRQPSWFLQWTNTRTKWDSRAENGKRLHCAPQSSWGDPPLDLLPCGVINNYYSTIGKWIIYLCNHNHLNQYVKILNGVG